MKKLNFRTLENLKIPDELTEKLLAIPERAEKKPAAAPFWRNRAVIAAASLVLVSILSLTVYFLLENKTNTSVSVPPSPYSTVAPSRPQGESDSAPSDGQQDAAATDETPSAIQKPINGLLKPSETYGAPSPTKPKSSPTDGAAKETTRPTIPRATERADSKPTEPPPATSQPTNAPTRPTTSPTKPPPWVWPLEPTEGEGTHPAVYPTQPEPKNYCYAYLPSSMLNGGSLYCWIQDKNGVVMGDVDLLSSQHLAEVVAVYDNGYVLARYSPNEHGIKPSSGYHLYGFINNDQETLFEDYAYMIEN